MIMAATAVEIWAVASGYRPSCGSAIVFRALVYYNIHHVVLYLYIIWNAYDMEERLTRMLH